MWKENSKNGKHGGSLSKFPIAGTSFLERPDQVMDGVRKGSVLSLVPEPDNAYDKNAIMLCNRRGEKLGYVPAKINKGILTRLFKESLVAVVEKVSQPNKINPFYGVVVSIVEEDSHSKVDTTSHGAVSDKWCEDNRLLDGKMIKSDFLHEYDLDCYNLLLNSLNELELDNFSSRQIAEAIDYMYDYDIDIEEFDKLLSHLSSQGDILDYVDCDSDNITDMLRAMVKHRILPNSIEFFEPSKGKNLIVTAKQDCDSFWDDLGDVNGFSEGVVFDMIMSKITQHCNLSKEIKYL